MKLYFSILCVLLLVLSYCDAAYFGSDCGNNRTHNFYFGRKTPSLSLLYSKHVYADSKILRKISVDAIFPTNGTLPLGQIHYIEALDQTSEGTGGCVYIKNGGVGNSFVTLHVKSQRGYGLNFYLFVYGILYH
ncbi:unnamed protein product [Nezara viridula]|uniref:Neuropeptide n=1 Tax=Nezara viridula TaxID=85310 RepID=A0A9P0HKL1_NEZVI|nr:unnamed protein product [Nezara viridula]